MAQVMTVFKQAWNEEKWEHHFLLCSFKFLHTQLTFSNVSSRKDQIVAYFIQLPAWFNLLRYTILEVKEKRKKDSLISSKIS